MRRILLAVAVLVCLSPALLLAVPSYLSSVPNSSVNSCLTCHTSMSGGPRNSFGNAFASNGHVWNATLAGRDSDTDAYRNGTELQDPFGSWVAGQPNPGDAAFVSNPGVSTSKPPAAITVTVNPTAVTVARGATFSVTATLTNNANATESCDFWVDLYLPNHQPYRGNPVTRPSRKTLTAHGTLNVALTYRVPLNAPAAVYTLTSKDGVYSPAPTEVWSQANTMVTVTLNAQDLENVPDNMILLEPVEPVE